MPRLAAIYIWVDNAAMPLLCSRVIYRKPDPITYDYCETGDGGNDGTFTYLGYLTTLQGQKISRHRHNVKRSLRTFSPRHRDRGYHHRLHISHEQFQMQGHYSQHQEKLEHQAP